MIYLDASALVTYVVERPNFAELREFLVSNLVLVLRPPRSLD